MATNIRQQIVDKIEERLDTIDTIKNVSVWSMTDLAPAQYPAILIRDTVDTMPAEGIIGRLDHELAVEVTALFFGQTSPADARQVIADIVASIGEDKTFDGLAWDVTIDTAELDIDITGKMISGAIIEITVFYRSELWTL